MACLTDRYQEVVCRMDAVDVVNSLPAERLEGDLLACCAAPAWGAAIAAKRPYRDRAGIVAAADAAARGLSWDEVVQALSAHPRIGERAAGDTKEAAWSRREQSAAAQTADETTKAALIEANRAYEKRFGQVFLIFASGRSQEEILAAARERLANDEAAERAVVTDELRKIALLRLERVLDAL
jgi:2-oxo-4-hydroxy-4-carboxy-5-ureidoimidazoline decarboxylase